MENTGATTQGQHHEPVHEQQTDFQDESQGDGAEGQRGGATAHEQEHKKTKHTFFHCKTHTVKNLCALLPNMRGDAKDQVCKFAVCLCSHRSWKFHRVVWETRSAAVTSTSLWLSHDVWLQVVC